MEVSNYELFNEFAGKILANLLEHIPLESTDDAGTIAGCTGSFKLGESVPKDWTIFRETVIWLRDEGFIKFGISDFQYEQPEFRYRLPKAKLTYKGLEALKSIPDPLNPTSSNTLADSLVDGAKEGTKGAMSDLTKQAFTLLFSSMVGS